MKFHSPSLLEQDSTKRCSVSVKRGHVTFGYVRIYPPPQSSSDTTATNTTSHHPNNDQSFIPIDEYEIMKQLNRKSFTAPTMKNKSKSSSQKSHNLQLHRRRRQPNHHFKNKVDEMQTIAKQVQTTQANHSSQYHHMKELIQWMDCESKITSATAKDTLPTTAATEENTTSISDVHGAVVQFLIIDKLQKRYQAKEKKLDTTKSSIHFNDTHSQNARSA